MLCEPDFLLTPSPPTKVRLWMRGSGDRWARKADWKLERVRMDLRIEKRRMRFRKLRGQ